MLDACLCRLLTAGSAACCRYALEQKAPICMLMGGGNTYEAAGVVAESIRNLFTKFQLGDTRGSTVELSPLMAADAADSVAP
jgi:hypothetical protein